MRRIGFPLAYKIRKNTDSKIRLSEPYYLYQSNSVRGFNRGWDGALMFIVENDTLSDLRDIDKRRRLSKDTIKEYAFRTSHELSEDFAVQSLFAPYLEKMKKSGNHVLYIESIQELKKTNSTLPNIFLQGDSIGISFYKDGFYNVLLPVEVK